MEFYGNGVLFWDSMKKANLIDFETFEKCFNKFQNTNHFENNDRKGK